MAFKAGGFFIMLRAPGGGGLFNNDGCYDVRAESTLCLMPQHASQRDWPWTARRAVKPGSQIHSGGCAAAMEAMV